MTELAVRTNTSGATLDSKIRYAQLMADAGLLPQAYRNNPANVLIAQEFGEALGIPTIQAINSIHVIEGKPSASSDLMAALVRRAGHKLRVTKEKTDDGWTVTAEIIRRDDPEFTYRAIWDNEKASKAGLLNKRGPWLNYPDQMMRSRAISEVCRDGASDALYGVVYTPEELGADVSAEGNVVAVQMAPSAPESIQQAIARDYSDPEPMPASQDVSDGPYNAGDAPVLPDDLRTAAQSKKLAILIRENQLERDEALAWMSGLIGRDLDSTKHLTKAEASTVIDALETAKTAGADPTTGEVVQAEVVEDWPVVAGTPA